MAWYRNGTISVTNGSAVVTGSGTLWVDAGVLNSGDITEGPDGKLYEVLSIQSNTALTLASNYLGASASGQSYAIMPIGLLPSALAQQVKTTLASANTALQSAILSTAGQSLTSTQQANARANIAALGAGDVGKGYLGKSVAGGVDVTLNTAEDAAEQLELTGTLTANINVIVSATARQRKVKNSTSGAYTVTVKTASGTGLGVGQGKGWTPLACDGTNVVNPIANLPGNLTVGGTLRLVSNGVDIAEIGPGGITVFSGKYSGARYDIDGWHFVGYNGNELRLGNWESGGEWTEFSTYIQGTKRTSVTSAGLTVIGALGVSGAATLSAGASLPLPSIGGSTAIEIPYYGDANAKTRIVATGTSDHRQTLKIQQNTAQSDAAPVDVVTLDASGNVGLGVTPSAWGGSNRKALQFVGGAAIDGSSAIGLSLLSNSYYNGANDVYIATGNAYKNEIGSGYIWKRAVSGVAGNAISWISDMTLDASGNLLVGVASGSNHRISKSVAEGSTVLAVEGTASGTYFNAVTDSAYSGAAAGVYVGKNSTTSRSINAAGTINASGADYAEYILKALACQAVAKGQIIGFDMDGRVIDRWSLAYGFGIKSTDPNLVGGDVWGSEDRIGKRPEQPVFSAPDYTGPQDPGAAPEAPVPAEGEDVSLDAEEAYSAALAAWQQAGAEYRLAQQAHRARVEFAEAAHAADMAAYQTLLQAFEDRLEAARQSVDRIAFSGLVPCNAQGAHPGDYIVAAEGPEDTIIGVVVSKSAMAADMTRYLNAVGRVRRVLPDGRAEVAVMVH